MEWADGFELTIAMTSRRKQLEQEIAKTDNPVVQMQLRELLNKEGKRQDKRLRRAERALDSLLRQAIDRTPHGYLVALIFLVLTIILFIVFLILEGLA